MQLLCSVEAAAEKDKVSREETRRLLAWVGTASPDSGKGSASLGNKLSKTCREETYREVNRCPRGFGAGSLMVPDASW